MSNLEEIETLSTPTEPLENGEWNPVSALFAWSKVCPNEVYLTQPRGTAVQTYTWSEAAKQVGQIAHLLSHQGLKPGDKVALISKNCAHWVMGQLAIWAAGLVSVPIIPTLNSETVEYVLNHSEAKFALIGEVEDWASLSNVFTDTPCLFFPNAAPNMNRLSYEWDGVIQSNPPVLTWHTPKQNALASIVYTSGTTGVPKGVMIGFQSYEVSSGILDGICTQGREDRVLSYLPMAHVFESAAVLASSLRYGFKVFFNESPETFDRDLKRAMPTLFISVPRLWTKFHLAALKRFGLQWPPTEGGQAPYSSQMKSDILEFLGFEHIRAAITGSAPLSPSIIDWYRSLGLELLEGYGMSEDFCFSHISLPGKTKVGYVGHLQKGVKRRIADNGEILIKSPSRMIGYFKDPEKTNESFTMDGYFKTGDMGEVDSEGRLKITGRLKELFKTSKGKYVVPSPIEKKMANHPFIECVCVIGEGEPQPIVLIMPPMEQFNTLTDSTRDRIEAELTELLSSVNQQLNPHEKLAYAVIVKDAWLSSNGLLTQTLKISRAAIEKKYKSSFEVWAMEKRSIVWEQ